LVDAGSKFSSPQLIALLHTPTAAMTAGGMPRVSGTTAEIASLVAYLRSLKSTGTARGQAVGSKVVVPPVQVLQAPAPGSPGPPTTPPTAAATSAAAKPPSEVPPPAAAAPASATVGQSTNSQAQRGEAFFVARGCTACHGIGGVGTKTGPALAAFSKTLTSAALTSLLQHPNQKMKAGGMPATNMSAADMSALVAYLQHLGSPVTAPPATAAATRASAPGQPATAGTLSDSTLAATGAAKRPMNLLEFRGQSVFAAHLCATCHGTNGVRGTWAAPPLANTGKNFPPALLITLLQHPTARMRQGGMPAVSIRGGELDALVAYIAFISAQKPAPPLTPR
jgi:mono/diheme cytochrome c family protein